MLIASYHFMHIRADADDFCYFAKNKTGHLFCSASTFSCCLYAAPMPENIPTITWLTIKYIPSPTSIKTGVYLKPFTIEPDEIADIIILAKPVTIIMTANEK